MTLSYKKLWHRLIDKEMTKTELQKAAGLSWGTVAKLNRGENVQPTPVFLLGESEGWWSLVGCRLWGRTESDTTEAT